MLGAGTGLGVSGLVPDGSGGWVPLEGEGGHVTLPAVSARERLVMDGLTRLYGRASAERLCSGQGLVDAFTLLCEADGVASGGLSSAAAVTDAALKAQQPQALEALNMLCAVLGSVAGNLALTLGARGGVFVGGGIVPRLGSWFDTSPFRERFEAKGRFQGYLKDSPRVGDHFCTIAGPAGRCAGTLRTALTPAAPTCAGFSGCDFSLINEK